MMTTTALQSNYLTDLAARIRGEHEACISALQRGLAHAIAAGKLLLEAKEQIPHGQWLPWLREHAQIPERTAQRYMKVAPWAAEIKSDKMADLTGNVVELLAPPRPPDQAETWEELSAWAQQLLDGPFTDSDCERDDEHRDWLRTKLMHQAQLPAFAAWCFDVAEFTADGRPALRLCPWDDLVEAAKALAPIADGKRALKINCRDFGAMSFAITVVQTTAMWLLGNLLSEMDYREKINDDRYEREFEHIHQHVMAQIESALGALRSRAAE
jgi:hypothetical protein